MRGQEPILIYLGDFDPTGLQIPKALVRNMKDHHSVDVKLIRAGLNLDQVEKYDLPMSVDAAKPGDPNTKRFIEEFGKDVRPVELDALHPALLQEITESSLKSVYDMSDMMEQKEVEKEERKKIKEIKRNTVGFLKQTYPDLFAMV